jgi:hypothetical protein
MRRVTLSLVVLVVVGLAASTALAGPHSPTVSLGVGTTLVGHPGGHGYRSGSYGYRSYGYGYRYPYGYHSHRRSLRAYHPYSYHPPVVVPFPGHPPVVHPPTHRYRSYHHSPHGGIHYRGRGFGISIGF